MKKVEAKQAGRTGKEGQPVSCLLVRPGKEGKVLASIALSRGRGQAASRPAFHSRNEGHLRRRRPPSFEARRLTAVGD